MNNRVTLEEKTAANFTWNHPRNRI